MLPLHPYVSRRELLSYEAVGCREQSQVAKPAVHDHRLDREAADTRDQKLIEARDYATLLAAHWEPIKQLARTGAARRRDSLGGRSPVELADEVASRTAEHLLRELTRGRRYSVPFRVVVYKRVGWTLATIMGETFADPLPMYFEDWRGPNPFVAFEQDYDMKQLFAGLPLKVQRVLSLRHRLGLEITDIAELEDMSRNSVDQALYRGYKTLRDTYRHRPPT